MTISTDYSNHYNEKSLLVKIKALFGKTAYSFLLQAVALYLCAQDSRTPAWAKGVIIGALGYFISPIDAIPDMTPFVGLTDDWSVISLAIATLGANLKQEHYDDARKYLDTIFQVNKKSPPSSDV